LKWNVFQIFQMVFVASDSATFRTTLISAIATSLGVVLLIGASVLVLAIFCCRKASKFPVSLYFASHSKFRGGHCHVAGNSFVSINVQIIFLYKTCILPGNHPVSRNVDIQAHIYEDVEAHVGIKLLI